MIEFNKVNFKQMLVHLVLSAIKYTSSNCGATAIKSCEGFSEA